MEARNDGILRIADKLHDGILRIAGRTAKFVTSPSSPHAWHAHCISNGMVSDNRFFSATILQLIEYYGIVDLALMLDVDAEELYQWAEGRARPPADVFLRVIDLRNDCSVNA